MNPLVAIVFGYIMCCILGCMANFCPSSIKNECMGFVGCINCVICIFVIYILATAK